MRPKRLLGIASAVLLAACAPVAPPAEPDEREAAHVIHVASNGWHTGIIVAAADVVASGRVPEAADFPGAAFFEFGWGDREYYPSPRPTIGMALAAALTPSPSVMHLAALARPPGDEYPEAEVLAVSVTGAGLARLIDRIGADFDRPEGGRARAVAEGLRERSAFYPAHGAFHLFNTCNTWTARMLETVVPGLARAGVVTADELMGRLRALPRAARRAPALP